MPGETSNNQSNFNKQEVSLYAHIYEKHVEIRNADGTVEITPDKYHWYNGSVILEYVDCRPQPTCTGKRILLRQNTASLWDDVLRINQDAGGTMTQEIAIQMESQLLLHLHPAIDLDPNSTLQGMKRYDPADGPVVPVNRELKTKKRKLNSYELEQEAAKKAKKEQMMFMMDERHGREFKPTFKLLPYFKSNRNKVSVIGKGKQRADIDMSEQSRNAKKLGRKLVRQLRFERNLTEAGDQVFKLFTLLNIYQEVNGKYEAIFHSLNEKDLHNEGKHSIFLQTVNENKEYKLDDNRATFRNELIDTEAYKAFIKSFIVLYSIDNNLKYDSGVDKVPVEMLTEVTTELTSPQTGMKFDDDLQPYKIIELLGPQSNESDAEKITNSNEGTTVGDLYNAAAKKAMQAKPSVNAPVNQDTSLMPPPPKPPTRRNSNRSRQTATTQAQVPAPIQSQNNLVLMNHQQSVQQQIPQAQIQQPQVMAASQSPSQRPIQSIQPVQVPVPQLSTDGTRPIPQPISIPIQIQNVQGVPVQGVPVRGMPVQLMQRNNVQAIHNIRNIPQVITGGHRPIPVRLNIPGIPPHAAGQNVAQGTTIASPSMLNSRQKIPARRTTQGQPQQINISAQQNAQMNIPTQANSSQMSQVVAPQGINVPTVPTRPTDPTRVPHLNVQSQARPTAQIKQMNIPQVSGQANVQQTQTIPRIPGRVMITQAQINQAQAQMNQAQMNQAPMNQAPMNQAQMNQAQMNQAQMNQARSTPQINIPSDQMQATPRSNNPVQMNATNQMNVQNAQQILQMNPQARARMDPRMNVQLQPNVSAQRISQAQAQAQLQLAMNAGMNPGRIQMFARPRMNMQQPFVQNVIVPMQNQLVPGQQQSAISQMRFQPTTMLMQRPRQPIMSQQMAAMSLQSQMQNQMQNQINQMNMNRRMFQSQNQPSQQLQHSRSPWNGSGNAGGK